MILIADSGSTKTDWRIIDKKGDIQQAKTIGFNPFYQESDEIRQELHDNLLPQIQGEISEVHFYGAGCSSASNKKSVTEAIQAVFPQAEVHVEHDLLAAARALCGHEAGIACILGTGSNSCLYDGKEIVNNIPSLGFLLGDEGSGNALGRVLVKDYLRGQLPSPLKDRFEKRFTSSADEIMDQLYKKPFPNRYLAQFSKFLFQNIKEPYAYRLVYHAFEIFFENTVMKYEGYQSQKVHFTGSVAFYFSNILRQVANDKGIMVKNILENPIAGLTLFHQKTS